MSEPTPNAAPSPLPDKVEAAAARVQQALQATAKCDPPNAAEVTEVGVAGRGGASADRAKATRAAAPRMVVGSGAALDPPDYEILAEAGRGGMGVVYQARHKGLNRVVALKMIRAGAHASPDVVARFQVEAEVLASVQHPNIVQVYDVGVHEGCPFLAMEFLNGGNLEDYIAGRPPPRAAAELVETLARAMHAAHLRGIVHRDLKPANILLAARAGKEAAAGNCNVPIPKISDFGIAKRFAEGTGQTATGVIMGTPSYMAPEQAEGRAHQIGPATDIYALGAILYALLTGQPPFFGRTSTAVLQKVIGEEPTSPSRLSPKLPRDLETICLKCLEKNPSSRYASAECLADDLRRFLIGEPIAARPAGMVERAGKWARRRPAWALLIGVSAVAALALAAVGISWSIDVRAERDRARHRLQVARKAIDDLYVKMASERLFDEPQLDPLCHELLDKGRVLYEELAQEQSADPDVRRDIAVAWFRLGEIHRLQDQHAEAESAYGEAIARQEELRRDHPREARYRQDLANSHNWLGELLRERGGRTDEAEAHYRTALALQEELADALPNEAAYRAELARSHYNLGIIHKDTNRLAEARADCDRAVELLTELYQQDQRNPLYRQDLARALINRGLLHKLGDRREEAGRDYDVAIDLLVGLHHEFGVRALYKFELAIARQNRGNVYLSQGRNADAQQDARQAQALYGNAQREHHEALTLLRGLVDNFSSRPRYKKKMGLALKNLGAALAPAGDLDGAEECSNEARRLFEALVERDPESADYQASLGMTLGQLGWLRTEQKNWPAARPLIEQAIVHMREALKWNPGRPDYRQELRDQYRDLAWSLVQLGDHAAAAEAAAQLTAVFPEQAQYRYYAACLLARCIPLAKDKGLAQRYIDQAMSFLAEAVANAPPNLERIPDEKTVFQPLRGHAQFDALLRQLDAKAPSGKASP